MRLFHVASGVLVETADGWFRLAAGWDDVVNRDDVETWVTSQIAGATLMDGAPDLSRLLPPIKSQEVWAAGVTYYPQPHGADGGVEVSRRRRLLRSGLRGARGRSCSSRRRRAASRGHGQPVRIRKDSTWNVPEPELALYVSAGGDDRRLHDRQRHELPRHRGREPALPAAGEGLRRQLRPRAGASSCRRRHCRPAPRSVW